MILISVSEEVMINPEMISSVEFRVKGNTKKVIVRIQGKDHVIDNPRQFFKELKSHGIDGGDQFVRS